MTNARIVRGDVRAFCRLHKTLGGCGFSYHVAAMADGYEVRQAVRGFVISTKRGCALDMMHVKIFTYIRFCLTAILTGVAVSLACLSPLLIPVWAIVEFVTALPVLIIRAPIESVGAFLRAKAIRVKPVAAVTFEGLVTLFTDKVARGFSGVWVWRVGSGNYDHVVGLGHFSFNDSNRTPFVQTCG